MLYIVQPVHEVAARSHRQGTRADGLWHLFSTLFSFVGGAGRHWADNRGVSGADPKENGALIIVSGTRDPPARWGSLVANAG
jgi:hypothetical protein